MARPTLQSVYRRGAERAEWSNNVRTALQICATLLHNVNGGTTIRRAGRRRPPSFYRTNRLSANAIDQPAVVVPSTTTAHPRERGHQAPNTKPLAPDYDISL